MRRLPTTGLIALAFVAAAGCATSGATPADNVSPAGRDPALLLPGEPAAGPEGRTCTIGRGAQPAPASIIDVDEYRAAVARALPASPAGAVLLSVGIDSTGTLRHRAILHTTLNDSMARAVADALDGHVRTATHDGRTAGWQHRLLIRPGSDDDWIRVGPSVSCMPRLRNRNDISLACRTACATTPPS
ncbi:MAG TPA: hypothetical protein VJ957_05665 [Longimicrobiales bacterium]|nr:hypothetical protein [Longimicrobiales bacterium]